MKKNTKTNPYGNQIINRYDAGGKKLRSQYMTRRVPLAQPLTNEETDVLKWTYTYANFDVATTDYVDNFEYGNTLKIHHTEGYVTQYPNGGYVAPNYHYYRKDHLGSTREVWRAPYTVYVANNVVVPGETVQRTQYYPSGLPWAEGYNPSTQQRKYNGKEWIEAHGLDEYDSQARMYYPAIMRTTTLDPLAEKYYSISPYAWCGNNPVRNIDPDGMEVDVTYLTDRKQVAALYEIMGTQQGRDFIMQFLKKDTGLKFTFGGKDYSFIADKDGKFNNSVLAFYSEKLPMTYENSVLKNTLGINEEFNFNVYKNNAPQFELIETNKNYDTRAGVFFKISLNPIIGTNVDEYINTTLHELFVHTEQDLKTLNSINSDLNKGNLRVGTDAYQLRLNGFNNASGDHSRLGSGKATGYRTASTQIDLIRKLSYQLRRYNEDVQRRK